MGFPMMVTYHPSYLLHNPSKTSKRKVWEDFLLVMEKLEMPVSENREAFSLELYAKDLLARIGGGSTIRGFADVENG